MRRTLGIVTALAALSLVYCSDPAGLWDGPIRLGIESGDGQVVTAGDTALIAPVVGRAVRDETSRSMVLGAGPLNAQTVIGTGVANVLTCATPTGAGGLVPYIQCAQTDTEGYVRYWFQPGTIAGEACAEIRAEMDGQPSVVATTCSEVEPGPLARFRLITDGNPMVAPGDTIDIRTLLDSHRDEYGNAVPVAAIEGAGPVVQWAWHDRVGGSNAGDWEPVGSGWLVVVPDPASEGYAISYDGNYALGLHAWIDGTRSEERATYRSPGQ